MYAWYFPKDSPSPGAGHRHDWESAVVWLDSLKSQNIVAIAASAHGGFNKDTSDLKLDGSRPKIRYFNVPPSNHQLGTTRELGCSQPLIAWESLTDAARKALTDADFEVATFDIKDARFMDTLARAEP